MQMRKGPLLTRNGNPRQVTTEEAEKRAQEFNVMFIETSAKAGHNVKTLFKKIAQALPGMDKDAGQEGAGGNKSEPPLHDQIFLVCPLY